MIINRIVGGGGGSVYVPTDATVTDFDIMNGKQRFNMIKTKRFCI